MTTSNTIYLDLETTGLNYDDEILQIAIIDDDANVLLNSYVKPIYHKEWKEAEYIHGITPEDVSDAPSIIDLMPKIKAIIKDKKLVIYNADYDTSYLRNAHDLATEVVCCMLLFAEEYGDWNDYFRNYKWQKLSKASRYVKHNLEQAHDALSDVLATRAVYHYLTYDNDLKTERHRKRAEARKLYEKKQYDEYIRNLDYHIQCTLEAINFNTEYRIKNKAKKIDEAIIRFRGYPFFYYDRRRPHLLFSTDAVLAEANRLGLPVITTKTIPSKYLDMNYLNYNNDEDKYTFFENNLYDAIYYNPDKQYICPVSGNKCSYKLLFINPNPVKRKVKPKNKLPKIDIKKLTLPIIYGVKIPDGYITKSSFEDHVNTSKLQPSAYLVPKTQTKYTELYKISDYKKCDYSYYRNWCEVPNKFWFTRTEMKRRFKVPHKLFKGMDTQGEIKLHGDYFYLYEVPKEYRTENIL